MSYILDALKKAEQERGNPQLQTVAAGRAQRTDYRYLWWPVAGALVLFAAAMICFVLFYPKPSRQAQVQQQTGASKQPEAGAAMTPIPAIVPSEAKQEPAVAAMPSREPESVRGKPIENRSNASEPKPVQAVPRQNEPAVQRVVSQPAPPVAVEKVEPAPVSLREAILKMKITVLMYSEVPSERVVFINGKKYSEGDHVEGRYLLEKITIGGAELTYMSERALLRP